MEQASLGAAASAPDAPGSTPTLSAGGGSTGEGFAFPMVSTLSPVTLPVSHAQVGENLEKGSLDFAGTSRGVTLHVSPSLPGGSGPLLQSAANSVGKATGTGNLGTPMTVWLDGGQNTLDTVSLDPITSVSAGSLKVGGGSVTATAPSADVIDGGLHVASPLPPSTFSCSTSAQPSC
jgi:hypothetical protein